MTNAYSYKLNIRQWWNTQSTQIGIGKLSNHVSKLVLLLENKNLWYSQMMEPRFQDKPVILEESVVSVRWKFTLR